MVPFWFVLCGVVMLIVEKTDGFEPLEAVFFEEKPFIYTEGNEIKGMFKEYFDSLTRAYCIKSKRNSNALLIKYVTNLGIGHKHLSSRDKVNERTVFFPYLTDGQPDSSNTTSKIYKKPIEVFSSKGLAVVVRTKYITFVSKFKRAFYTMESSIFVLIAAVVVGMLFWLFERNGNDQFQKKFTPGFCEGVWLAFVTMTSVGYGDVAPKKFISRFIAVVWMLCGLVMSSLMVGTVSSAFLGFEMNALRGAKVSVLKGIESKIFKEKYNSRDILISEYSSYDEVIRAVREGDVFAAVLNTDIAAYRQMDFNNGQNPLSVAAQINIEVPISILADDVRFKGVQCSKELHEKALRHAYSKHRKKLSIETIHYDGIIKTLTCSNEGFFALLTAALLLCCGLFYDFFTQARKAYLKFRGKHKSKLLRCEESVTLNNAGRKFDDELSNSSKEMSAINTQTIELYELLVQRVSLDSEHFPDLYEESVS